MHLRVEQAVVDRFEVPQHEGVRALLARIRAEWQGPGRGQARIQLACLRLAAGDLLQLRQSVAAAEIDWRDVLVSAGLGNADWPEVLRRDGWPVPD
ncbi:MAG TPA: hypothetical protein VK348_15440 [Planctomycetota bacterium]|nr:hypothetical protein [Planctomycetota bacterium]